MKCTLAEPDVSNVAGGYYGTYTAKNDVVIVKKNIYNSIRKNKMREKYRQ
ncbi:MAG: hypothetical protein ACYC2P_09975 [Paludibacteraceae bacterium]